MRADGEFVFLYVYNFKFRHTCLLLNTFGTQLLPKPQPAAHFYELELVEDGVGVVVTGDHI